MKNKLLEILVILLVAELLVVGFAFIAGGNNLLAFPTVSELFAFERVGPAEGVDTLLSGYERRLSESSLNPDSLQTSFSPVSVSIENPVSGGKSALDNFFDAVIFDSKSKVVRVAHFGDSQLEGDRISYILRNKLQSVFGGKGIGFLPMADLVGPVSYYRNSSLNWTKYQVFNKPLPGGEPYGLGGMAFRFSHSATIEDSVEVTADVPLLEEGAIPEPPLEEPEELVPDTSVKKDTVKKKRSRTLYFSDARITYRLGSVPQQVELHFGSVNQSCSLTVRHGKSKTLLLAVDLLESATPGSKLNILTLPAAESYEMVLTGDESPVFYGVYANASSGIALDNYSIRGHSGAGLMRVNAGIAQLQNRHLNTKLLIFQFGGNIAPFVDSQGEAAWAEELYFNLFEKYRIMFPDASILVISPGDMGTVRNGILQSYPGMGMIRDAIRRAARRAGCAYWDALTAMGGPQSVIAWSAKGLAAKDGHLSDRGARIISAELLKALMNEFVDYKKRKGL